MSFLVQWMYDLLYSLGLWRKEVLQAYRGWCWS